MSVTNQRALLPLEDDPLYPGFQQPKSMHTAINRISPDFDISSMMLKLRTGQFTTGLTQMVELNVVGQKIKPALIAICVLFGIGAVGMFVLFLHCRNARTPSKMCGSRTLWRGLGIFVTIMLVLTIVICVLYGFLDRYSTYNLVFHRLPELVATVNTRTAASTAVLPPQILAFNIQEPGAELRQKVFSVQTIGSNWLKNKKIATSTQLVDAMKDNTDAVKKSAYFLAGATNEALSDAFMGQLLCLSFISVIGDLGSVAPPSDDRPAWLKKQADSTVFFDLGSTDFGTHGTGTLWGLCHQLVACNAAFPPCYAWVRADAEDPCKCALVAVRVNGKYLQPTDAGWVCAKAMVMMQAFHVIEAMHLCMHKISELNAIAAQYSVLVSDPLYALLEPFTMNAMGAELELSTVLVTPKIQTLMAFAYVTEFDAFKALLPPLLTFMVSNKMESPCRDTYEWWGAYQAKRETIFDTTYAPLMHASAEFPAFTSQLAAQCNVTPQDPAAFAANVLKVVSIYHASATFTGARMSLCGFTQLALGMMQHGATMSTDKWTSWKGLLPTLGADDFTAWWAEAMALGYATGESDGPYLLDPAGYYAAGLSPSHTQALQQGFDQMKALGQELYDKTKACAFKPTWYYAPEQASQSMTTMTSGTYI